MEKGRLQHSRDSCYTQAKSELSTADATSWCCIDKKSWTLGICLVAKHAHFVSLPVAENLIAHVLSLSLLFVLSARD